MLMNKTEFWLMNNPVRRALMFFEARKLKKMAGKNSFGSILELGCGEGQGTKNVLRLFSPSSIHAIDLDPKMIARAKQRVNDKRVTFAVGDAANLSFAKDASFDAVFDFGIIHHIPNWQDCLDEVNRVLKPGGLFLLEDLSIESFTKGPLGKTMHRMLEHPYDRMYTKAAFEEELKRLGLVPVKTYELRKVHMFWKVLKKPEAFQGGDSSSKSSRIS
jgi:ubiquinone/menaquinone biosynthesis C-methylase UbiE